MTNTYKGKVAGVMGEVFELLYQVFLSLASSSPPSLPL